MDTGWTQADIKRRNCEWDLKHGRLEQESEVFPLDHSLFVNQTASDVNYNP